jgi:hypothetical protein
MRTLKMIPAVLVMMAASNVFAKDLPCNHKDNVALTASTNPPVKTASQTKTQTHAVRAAQ